MNKKEIKELDAEVSAIVRRKTPRCELCSGVKSLQCAHYFPRGHYSTRWYLPNLMTLCYACHFYKFPNRPAFWSEFMIKKLGIREYLVLRELASMSAKPSEINADDVRKTWKK